MPFIPKSTGIPTVDKVFKEVFAILNRFQGGEVASSSGESVYWADIINKPTTFPPASHTQDISTINNLQTTLDGKEPVIVLGTGNKYLFRDKTWKEIDWSEIINKPSTYSPTSHIHIISDVTGLQTTLDNKQPLNSKLTDISNLSVTDGLFLVGNGSSIVSRALQNSDLPAIAITDTFVVASQAAMLALSAAERGDVAVRSDLNKSFILKGDNPASLSDWQELLTPTDAVLSVDGRTGVVSLSDKYQPLDTDLTTIAGLTHSNRHVMVSNGSSWTRRALEEADLPSLSAAKITSGTLDNARLSFNPNCFVQGINSRRSVILGSASPLDSNKHSTFFTMYSSDPTYDSRLSGHGIGFRSQHGENDGYALDMIGNTYGDGTLLFGGVYNNVRQPWRAIWHEGNFNPSSYYTKTELQTSGSSQVHWGNIINKPSTFAPAAHDHAWSEITGKPSTFAPASHTHSAIDLPASIVYTDNAQTITGVKTFNPNTNFGNTITFTGTNKRIVSNTATTDKNSAISLGYPNAANSGYVVVHEINNTTRAGDVVLQAGGNNGAIYMSPRAYFGTRPANDHRWTLALDQHNTLFSVPSNGLNIMHNLYNDGSWRYRYGSGSNSGGAVLTLAYNQFSVQVANNGTADQVATLTPAIHTNLNGNTAFGKNTFVGGYRVEVEGNTLISETLTAGWVTASSGADITTLQIHDKIQIKNKAGNAWLNFVTRDVSGSEVVADLSNVGKISMISPSTNNTMELYVDSSSTVAGINAKTGLLEIRNTSTATTGDILIQSVTSDINISSLGESGEISLDAKRVKISRRNLKSQTFTYTVNGSYIIDLNNYLDVNLFIINSTATWVSIGFKNATVGDEIHVNIKGYGAIAYQRDPNSGNAWYEWPNDPIELDEFFYKLICTGTDNYYGQTINTWIIGS